MNIREQCMVYFLSRSPCPTDVNVMPSKLYEKQQQSFLVRFSGLQQKQQLGDLSCPRISVSSIGKRAKQFQKWPNFFHSKQSKKRMRKNTKICCVVLVNDTPKSLDQKCINLFLLTLIYIYDFSMTLRDRSDFVYQKFDIILKEMPSIEH